MKLASLFLLFFAAFAGAEEASRPNIIYILSDDLAQGDVLGAQLLERLHQRAAAPAELLHAARHHIHQKQRL